MTPRGRGSGDGRAPAADRQPAHRARLGGVARHRTGLSAWQARALPPGRWRFAAILLDPPRAELARCDRGAPRLMLR